MSATKIQYNFKEADGDEKVKTREAEVDTLETKMENGSTLNMVEKGQSEDEKPEKHIMGGTNRPYVAITRLHYFSISAELLYVLLLLFNTYFKAPRSFIVF